MSHPFPCLFARIPFSVPEGAQTQTSPPCATHTLCEMWFLNPVTASNGSRNADDKSPCSRISHSPLPSEVLRPDVSNLQFLSALSKVPTLFSGCVLQESQKLMCNQGFCFPSKNLKKQKFLYSCALGLGRSRHRPRSTENQKNTTPPLCLFVKKPRHLRSTPSSGGDPLTETTLTEIEIGEETWGFTR